MSKQTDREIREDGTILAHNQESAPTDRPTECGYWRSSTWPGTYRWVTQKTDAELAAMLNRQAQVSAKARREGQRRDWHDAYQNGEGDY